MQDGQQRVLLQAIATLKKARYKVDTNHRIIIVIIIVFLL